MAVNHLLPMVPISQDTFIEASEFDEYGQIDSVLNFLEVWGESRHECSRRATNVFHDWRRWARSRGNPSRSGEIRHIRRAVYKLRSERDVLARHPVKGSGHVPRLKDVARIFGEVWRARSCRRTIDRRQ